MTESALPQSTMTRDELDAAIAEIVDRRGIDLAKSVRGTRKVENG